MNVTDYNELVLKLYEVRYLISLCHPVIDADVISNLKKELEDLAKEKGLI